LADAVSADVSGLSGSCADILEHRKALWTFVDQAGVEPTNNHAEREIRAFVLGANVRSVPRLNLATDRCSSTGDAPTSAESTAIVSPGSRLNASKKRSPSANSFVPDRRLPAARATRGRDGAAAGAATLALTPANA
jgi:transposase